MSNTSKYDGDFYEWFAELLISQGCPKDKARECVESMKEPTKRTYGDLTVREVWAICNEYDKYDQCHGCPLARQDLCIEYVWGREEKELDTEVDL